jgi:ribosomal protein S18 acetylase RimI-like enzyme
MLGREAVRRYYLWQLIGPHDIIAVGAYREEELVGYCFAGVFRGAISGFLRRNRFYLIRCALLRPWIILHPKFLSRLRLFLRTLRPTKSPSSKTPVSATSLRRFGILAIAVNPACQGGGIGRTLMRESESVAESQGFQIITLTVDPSNTQAIRFYESLGYHRDITDTGWRGGMTKEIAPVAE